MAQITAHTLARYTTDARAALAYYMQMDADAFEHVHVTVSTGNKKLGKCLNVSLLPVITCPDCNGCARACYAIRSALRFPAVLDSYARNTAIMMREPLRYWSEVRQSIRRHPSYTAFRFHVAGDILTEEYARHMFAVAEEFPRITFWTYTKNARVLTLHGRPRNLSIMQSTGFGVPFDARLHGQFHCVRAGQEAPAGVYHCPGNCQTCVNARRGCPVNENAWIDEH